MLYPLHQSSAWHITTLNACFLSWVLSFCESAIQSHVTSSGFPRAGWAQETEGIQEQSFQRQGERSIFMSLNSPPRTRPSGLKWWTQPWLPSLGGQLGRCWSCWMHVLKQSVGAAPSPPLSSFSQACPGLCLEAPTHLHSDQAQKESFFDAKYQPSSLRVWIIHRQNPAPICLQSALLTPFCAQHCPRHPQPRPASGFLRGKMSLPEPFVLIGEMMGWTRGSKVCIWNQFSPWSGMKTKGWGMPAVRGLPWRHLSSGSVNDLWLTASSHICSEEVGRTVCVVGWGGRGFLVSAVSQGAACKNQG